MPVSCVFKRAMEMIIEEEINRIHDELEKIDRDYNPQVESYSHFVTNKSERDKLSNQLSTLRGYQNIIANERCD